MLIKYLLNVNSNHDSPSLSAIQTAEHLGLSEAYARATLADVLFRAGSAARGDVTAACRDLRADIAHSDKVGLLNASAWSRLSLAEIEVEHKLPTARRTLADLSHVAAARHLRLLSREAAELSRRLHAPE